MKEINNIYLTLEELDCSKLLPLPCLQGIIDADSFRLVF